MPFFLCMGSFRSQFDFVCVEESRTIKEHIDKGLLLPDELVLKFVAGELKKIRDKGFLLDGKKINLAWPFYLFCSVWFQVILEH